MNIKDRVSKMMIAYIQSKYSSQIELTKDMYKFPVLGSNADIVISGCSYSFGIGVPEDMSWGVQVADHLDLKYHNLSKEGKSVVYLVNSLFSYFKCFGNPKILVCLFPKLDRFHIYSDPNHMISESKLGVGLKSKLVEDEPLGFAIHSLGEYDKYSKAPHIAEKMIPKETAVSMSIQYIKFLEMYCKASGIKLIWSTWDKDFEYVLKTFDPDFENFISIDEAFWHIDTEGKDTLHKDANYVCVNCNQFPEKCAKPQDPIDCHLELREIYGENWDLGSDYGLIESKRGHWGIHRHVHVAEIFTKEILNDSN
jgi:hypothetical protein